MKRQRKTKPALWMSAFPPARQKSSLKPEYEKRKRLFLKSNPRCARCPRKSHEVHHSRGRIGRLLILTEFWIALCRKCHDWVHQHPKQARAEGLLCLPGMWNVVPPEAKP